MFEMIIDSIMPNILEIVLTIISLTVSYYVIPCIKAHLVPFLKEKRLYNIVKSFVQAAEKLSESGVIDKDDKKKYVIDLLKKNGVVVDEIVDSFIESCVKEIDMIDSVIYEEVIEAESEVEISGDENSG